MEDKGAVPMVRVPVTEMSMLLISLVVAGIYVSQAKTPQVSNGAPGRIHAPLMLLYALATMTFGIAMAYSYEGIHIPMTMLAGAVILPVLYPLGVSIGTLSVRQDENDKGGVYRSVGTILLSISAGIVLLGVASIVMMGTRMMSADVGIYVTEYTLPLTIGILMFSSAIVAVR